MKGALTSFVATNSRRIVMLTVLTVLLVAGAAGEAAAHNPAGHAVPACENGADVVAHQNPNCHP